MSKPASPPAAILWSHVNVAGPISEILRTPCWLWTASTNGAGYGQFQVGGQHGGLRALAHRFSYENQYGPIPEGLTVDHLCRNTVCVNPRDLEAVSRRTNVLREISSCARNAIKTQCPAGHEYTLENTKKRKGKRYCQACNAENLAHSTRAGQVHDPVGSKNFVVLNGMSRILRIVRCEPRRIRGSRSGRDPWRLTTTNSSAGAPALLLCLNRARPMPPAGVCNLLPPWGRRMLPVYRCRCSSFTSATKASIRRSLYAHTDRRSMQAASAAIEQVLGAGSRLH
jgi:HNH endonuclease